MSFVLTLLDPASAHIPEFNLTRMGLIRNDKMGVYNHVILSQKITEPKHKIWKFMNLVLLRALYSFKLHA